MKKYIIANRVAPISNDGWIHIVPKGELPNREAGIVQVLDDAAHDSMLAGIDADKQRLGANWPGIYAGEEHFIYDDTKSSAAFGWFKDFEKRGDGIWAKDDGLTDLGQEAIKNKRFKFTSFVADPADTQKLDGKRVRILKLETVGFTNAANGKELLHPITNRNEFSRGMVPSAENQRKPMKTVATKLGLSGEASEETILAEVTKFMNRAAEAEAKVAPLALRVTELETANGTLIDEQIAADLDGNGIKDEKIRNRVIPVLKPMKNREARLEFIKDVISKPAPANNAAGQRKLFNRDAKAPEGGDAGVADEAARVQKAEQEINQYKITNRCTYTQARQMVRSMKPELFGITAS